MTVTRVQRGAGPPPSARPRVPRRTAETLARDWRKAAWFYARFGITEA